MDGHRCRLTGDCSSLKTMCQFRAPVQRTNSYSRALSLWELALAVLIILIIAPGSLANNCSWLPDFCGPDTVVSVKVDSNCCSPSCETPMSVLRVCQQCHTVVCSGNAAVRAATGSNATNGNTTAGGSVFGNGTVNVNDGNATLNNSTVDSEAVTPPVEFALHLPQGDEFPAIDSPRLDGLFANNGFLRLAPGAFRKVPFFKRLDLSGNKLKEVDVSSFVGLELTLVELNLSSNHLTRVVDGAFSELSSLQTLSLSGNSIKALLAPVSRTGLATLWPRNGTLQSLYLANNLIEVVEARALSSLLNLAKLDLSGNRLRSVDFLCSVQPSLSSLTELHLDRNELGLGDFGRGGSGADCLGFPLTALHTLSLRHNGLQSDAFTLWLNDMAMRSVDIRDNKLSHVDACTRPNLQVSGNPFICSCDLARIPEAADNGSLPCSHPLTSSNTTVAQYVQAMCPAASPIQLAAPSECGRLSISVHSDFDSGEFSVEWTIRQRVADWFHVDTITSSGQLMRIAVASRGADVAHTYEFKGRLSQLFLPANELDGGLPRTALVCVVAVRRGLPAAYGQTRCQPLHEQIEFASDTDYQINATLGSEGNGTSISFVPEPAPPVLSLVFIGLFAGLLVIFLLTVLCLTKTKGKPFSVFHNLTYGNRVDDLNIYGRKPIEIASPAEGESGFASGDPTDPSAGKREVEGREDPLYEEMADCIAGIAPFSEENAATSAHDEQPLYYNTPANPRDSYDSDSTSLSGVATAMNDLDALAPSDPLPSIPFVPASVLEPGTESAANGDRHRKSKRKSGPSSLEQHLGMGPSAASLRRSSRARDDSVHYLYTHLSDDMDEPEQDDMPELENPTFDPTVLPGFNPRPPINFGEPQQSASLQSHRQHARPQQSHVQRSASSVQQSEHKHYRGHSLTPLPPAELPTVSGSLAYSAGDTAAPVRTESGLPTLHAPAGSRSKPRRHQSVTAAGSVGVKSRVHMLEQGMASTRPDHGRNAVSVRVKPARRHSVHRTSVDVPVENERSPARSYHNVAFVGCEGADMNGKLFF